MTPLPKEDVDSIVAHMNDNHGETLANYVRYFGGVKDVISVELKDITNYELHIDTVAHALSCCLAVQLIQPVYSAADARLVLVEMAKVAKEGLRRDD